MKRRETERHRGMYRGKQEGDTGRKICEGALRGNADREEERNMERVKQEKI